MSDLGPQRYVDERPPEHFVGFHEYTRTHGAGWVYTLARVLFTPIGLGPFRVRAIGREHVPSSGPVILAANHFSQWDHFIIAVWISRPLQFMAKSQLYANAVMDYLLTRVGAFPVHRGAGDDEWMKTALAILERGDIVLMYPEGGRSRTGAPGRARPGVGRLALESGVPVVPVATYGTLELRRWRQNLRRLRIPPVTVRYGEPLHFDRVAAPDADAQRRAAEEIFEHVRTMYAELDEALRTRSRRQLLREARSARAR